MQSISVFLEFADFRWKKLMSAELKETVTWFIYFLDLLCIRYNCPKFHHCRICVTDFMEGGVIFAPPIREQPRKSTSWIGLRLGLSHLREHKFRHNFRDTLTQFVIAARILKVRATIFFTVYSIPIKD